jgi:hypothetical protein
MQQLLNIKKGAFSPVFCYLAEEGGFEPPDRDYRSTVFKTAAFNHSATPPRVRFCA